MFQRGRKSRDRDGVLAVCPTADGVAAVQVRHGGAPQLEWASYVPLVRGERERAAALARLLERNAAGARATTSLLAGGEYNLLLIEAPEVPAEELREAVRWRVGDLVDFSLDEAVIDIFHTPPMKGGRTNMVYAVVARESAVRRVIDEVEHATRALDCVDIPEMAARNLAAQLPEDVAGVAVLALDDNSGLVTITRQGELFLSRRFDGGAARLLDGGRQRIEPSTEGIVDAIVIEIQRSLDYYESQFAQPPIRNLVVAPLGAPLEGFEDYLGSQLGIAVRTLDLTTLIECAEPLEPTVAARCALAIGAALREFGAAA